MTAPTPPDAHEEMALLDAIEQALLELTTAELEAGAAFAPLPSPLPSTLKTVIPAKAGTHTECDATDAANAVETQRGDGSRPAPG
jgi:hypothetical protein